MRYLLIHSIFLSGCVFNYGGNGQHCYPNGTCDSDLVCVKFKDAGAFTVFGTCANPNGILIGGKAIVFVTDGGVR